MSLFILLLQGVGSWRPSTVEFKRSKLSDNSVDKTIQCLSKASNSPSLVFCGTRFPSNCDREYSDLPLETKAERALQFVTF